MLTSAPEYLLWNYTYHCNLNCAHCYSRSETYPSEASSLEVKLIAESIAKANVFQIALGGGEVLYRRDVIDVIRILSDGGAFVSVTTNGWPISSAFARDLFSSGIGDVYVSIDSLDDIVHDSMRGRKGTLTRAIGAVEILQSCGITVKLSSVLTKETLGSMDSIIEFANQKRIPEINFKRFRPSGNGYKNRDKYELTSDTNVFIEQKIAQWRRDGSTSISLNFNPEANSVDSGCACGISSLTLRPNGDVALCSYSETILGRLPDNDLSELWLTSPILLAKRRGVSCEALHGWPSPSSPVRFQTR